MLNHRWQARDAHDTRLLEHGSRIREERRDSYAAHWLAWNQFIHELRRVKDQISELPPGTVVNRHLTHPVSGLADGAGLARQVQKLAG